MSLYQCEECGAMENTALGFYHGRSMKCWPEKYRDKKLCSECGPPTFPDSGKPTDWGKWHGQWEKILLPKGQFETNQEGNLAHKKTGDTDVRKFALTPNASLSGGLSAQREDRPLEALVGRHP